MAKEIKVRCCIAGGGPAGMMAGFLMARAGVAVAVLEKWPDFFRDFRGDTIHPSTLTVLSELGLLEAFLRLPHQEIKTLSGVIEGEELVLADFSHVKGPCHFIALVPQWDFLNFIADQAKNLPNFQLLMSTEVTDVLTEGGHVCGVQARGPEGNVTVRAELVLGADGRHSTIRRSAQLEVVDVGAPMDVLWFSLTRRPDDPAKVFGHVQRGRLMVTLDRGDYWQCGFVIAKGELESVRAAGLAAFQQQVAQLTPFVADRVGELKDWNEIKLLSVGVDHLRQWWSPGVLCIGDAAHAMSPVAGVGINLAVQDAVATANILTPRFLAGRVNDSDLAAVQSRRQFPTRMTQRLQVFIQNVLIRKVLGGQTIHAPWPIRLVNRFPPLRRIPARIVGLGFRPEHLAPGLRPLAAAAAPPGATRSHPAEPTGPSRQS